MTNDHSTLRDTAIRVRAIFGWCIAVLVPCLLPQAAWSQPIQQCTSATQQLQWYANQVIAEYHRVGQPIRLGCSQQCMGNMWCQQQCEGYHAGPLNQWYAVQQQQIVSQANLIAMSCLDDPSGVEFGSGRDPDRLDGKLRDLKRDVVREGHDKEVRIDIPDDVNIDF